MNTLEITILKNLINNNDYLRKVLPFIKEEYFENNQEKVVFNEIQNYVSQYNVLPTREILGIEVKKRDDLSETEFKNTLAVINQLKKDDCNLEWLQNKTEEWCKERAFFLALMKCVEIADDKADLSKNSAPQIMQDALTVSFDTHIGIDYFEDFKARFDAYRLKEDKLPFDLDIFNKITDGGLLKKSLTMILGGTGCHAKGTEILLNDGNVKKVEDISTDDVLIGNDGTPRYINSLVRNVGKMYKVKVGVTGDEFTVNGEHILSLINVSTQNIVNISVNDYLMKSNRFKHLHKLYYIKTPIEFEDKSLKLDPYFMGVYLGDGHTYSCAITNQDEEIINWVSNYVQNIDERIKIRVVNRNKNNQKLKTLLFSGMVNCGYQNNKNILSQIFEEYNLFFSQRKNRTKCSEKFIPHEYKTSSIQDRLDLLAGLIDSDGYKSHDGCYEITTKSKQLAEDIQYVSRSLSMGSKIRHKIINNVYYYTVLVTTSFDSEQIIPCKVKRKQTLQKNTKNKNPLHRSFIIEELGVDNYYGFNISGNNLYCMGNFIVTHNSGKSLFLCHFASAFLKNDCNVLYITLEMAENKIAERIDANLMEVPINRLSDLNFNSFEKKINNLKRKTTGKLVIKEYPTKSAHSGHFKSLLEELKLKREFVPDVLIVDYLNICLSSTYKNNANIGSYQYVKAIAEELRALGCQYNIPVLSATQMNRSGFSSSDPDLTDTSECIFVDEVIKTREGKIIKISDVSIGDQIESQDGYKTIIKIHPKEYKNCIQIKLKSGKTIIVSKDHVFPTDKGRKSFKSGLISGDKLNSI